MGGIPALPEEITAAWLTGLLGAAQDEIRDVTIRTAEAESGFVSLICFADLELAPGSALPSKLVIKLAPTHEGAREVATAFRLFAREQQFYNNVAPRLGIRTPRSYYADFDESSGLGVLVQQDCSHLRAFDQTLEEPATLGELERLIDTAATMAISSWEAPWLDTESEILTPAHPVSQAYYGGCEAGFPAVLESELMGWAPAGLREIVERMAVDYQRLVYVELEGNQSLAHLDYRLANFFYEDGADDPVILYDWSSMYKGRTAHDVGYLMSTCFSAEFRRTHEKAMMRRYHERLCDAGIKGYSWDDAWFDYRHGILIGFRLLPMALGDLDITTEGGEATFRKILACLPQAALDHGGVALIDEILARGG